MRLLSSILIVLFLAGYSVAGVKEEYELQEKCSKRCDDIFKKEHKSVDTTPDGQTINNYQNHYNKKLNKCFMLVTSISIPSSKSKGDVLNMKFLFDVNENKEYGSFSRFEKDRLPLFCNVLDTVCESEQEFDVLIKPYMNE